MDDKILQDFLEQFKAEDWYGLYHGGWKNEVIPASQSHPAKFSRRLIRRIYEHAFAEGWLKKGLRVLDIFGGVALGSLHAMQMGLNWVGVEIEPRWVACGMGGHCDGQPIVVEAKPGIRGWYVVYRDGENGNFSEFYIGVNGEPSQDEPDGEGFKSRKIALAFAHELDMDGLELRKVREGQTFAKASLCGNKEKHEAHEIKGNIQLWNDKYAGMPHWGTAVLLKGDSRKLRKVLAENGHLGSQDMSASSPPFQETNADGGWQMLGKYARQGRLTVDQVKGKSDKSYPSWEESRDTGPGDAAENLSNFDNGDYQAIVSSPPYAETGLRNIDDKAEIINQGRRERGEVQGGTGRSGVLGQSLIQGDGYGLAPENLGNLQPDGFDACLASPPYAQARIEGQGDEGASGLRNEDGSFVRGSEGWQKRVELGDRYGETPGQLGSLEAEHFDFEVGSPPFIAQGGGGNVTSTGGPLADASMIKRHGAGNSASMAYGEDSANLAAMDGEGFDDAVEKSCEHSQDNGQPDLALSSPPYVSGGHHPDQTGAWGGRLNVIDESEASYGKQIGQMGQMDVKDFDLAAASPPFSESLSGDRVIPEIRVARARAMGLISAADVSPIDSEKFGERSQEIGGEAAQLSHMANTEADFDLSATSPPYADSVNSEKSGIDFSKGQLDYPGRKLHESRITMQKRHHNDRNYGQEPGQLGAMEDKAFEGSVSSPPFEASTGDRPSASIRATFDRGETVFGPAMLNDSGYGADSGNIGNDSGMDFWSASKQILQELFSVLRPGAKAIFVLKRYIKDSKIVQFPAQWAYLAATVGFIPLHWHKCWMIEDRGTQYDLFGGKIEKITARYSFFRRLHAKKYPHLEIQYEDVICFLRP